MTTKILVLAAVSFTLSSSLALAKPGARPNQLPGRAGSDTPGTPLPRFELGGDTSASLSAGDATTIQLGFTAGYNVNTWMEPTLATQINYVSNGGHLTTVSILAGPTINLATGDGDLRDSFFLSALAGVQIADIGGNVGTSGLTVSGSDTEFQILGAVGKRFELTPSITYKPALGVSYVNGGSAAFVAIPASFSLIF